LKSSVTPFPLRRDYALANQSAKGLQGQVMLFVRV